MTTSKIIWRASVLLLLAGCGRDAEVEDFKTPGVGLNPDEIGPAPVQQGGLFEYHYIDFAGAALPLGLTGLVAFDPVGPEMLSMLPPYAMVYGQGFVLSSDIPQMDVAFGTFGAPLDTPGSCYTNYEPRAYLNTMADVGQAITFSGEGFEYEIGRRPALYAEANQKNLFPYYSGIAPHRPTALTGLVDAGEGSFAGLERQVIRPANWRHGAKVDIHFPGGIPPEDSSVSSIPMPVGALGADTTHYLPGAPDGVMLSWSGPLYDADGNEVGSGEQSRCLTFADLGYTPSSPEDCLPGALPDPAVSTVVDDIFDSEGNLVATGLKGQMYTAPWDTDGGSGVTFSWPEGSIGEGETVVVGVRLLGEVDLDSQYKQIAQIPVQPSPNLEDRWNMFADGNPAPEPDDTIIYDLIEYGAEMPTDTLYREPLACENEANGDFEWEPDPSIYKDGNPDNGYINSLQGEPTHTLAELVCNVPVAGTNSFTVTPDMLKFARDYGELHGASGAIFYFARSTTKNLDTPDVRDRYGNRKEISDVRVVTTSAKLGRFWWNQ